VPVGRHLQKGLNLKDEALSDNVRLYSVSTVTAVTVTRLKLLLLGVTMSLMLLNCRLTNDVDRGINRRSDTNKLSLGNLLDSNLRHQLMVSS
jgi:hypothetical protein